MDLRGVLLHRARDATVDAEDLVVDHGSEGQAIERLVAHLPELLSQRLAEAHFALAQEGFLLVVILPAVDLQCSD
jgi:hypothetical protein